MMELFPGAEGSREPLTRHIATGSNEYGFGATADRLAALAPAGAVSLDESEVEQDKITTPAAGIAVWVELVYPDGRSKTDKAFAQKWTPEAVYVQYIERSSAAYTWVRPDKVRRRQLEETRAESSRSNPR